MEAKPRARRWPGGEPPIPSNAPRRTSPAPARPREIGGGGSEEARELFTTLARTGLHLDALQRDTLREFGLAFTEYSVLRLLQRAPKRRLPPSVLADAILCTTGAMTKLVDRLQRAELVTREPDPDDRRGVLVRLERRGERTANQAATAYERARHRVLSQLDPNRVEAIHKSLHELLDAFETDRSPHHE